MYVWRLKTHHEEPSRALAWTKKHNHIAIGWGQVGDLSEKNFGSKEEISTAIKSIYPELGNVGDGGPSLWRLFSEVQVGDLMILSGDVAREFVVEVMGPYEWRSDVPVPESEGDYNHQRLVRKRYLNPDKLWSLAGAKVLTGHSPRGTLVRLAREVCNEDMDAF